uniref:Arylamine N-acetyltransferase n=1 Tax=Panagrolaimus sp. PS1159 TaxID=55785 RepID=A0AC35GQC3_9BILA
METENFVEEYLKRLEISYNPEKSDKENLIDLHISHLTHIPFETFDLIDLKELDISPKYILNRLIKEKRGGVCFQLNGSFEMLLKSYKYNVEMIPCCVFDNGRKVFGDINDHLALFVTLNDGTELLCDVGFSRNFLTPLFFKVDCVQFATNGFFRLTKIADGFYLMVERGYLIEKNGDENFMLPSSPPETKIVDIDPSRIKWTPSYRFSVDFKKQTTKLQDFKDASFHVINSPNCILNHLTICRIEKFQPSFIGAYGIIGNEFVECSVKNGIETQKHFPFLNKEQNELKNLLKEKFNLCFERNVSLVN